MKRQYEGHCHCGAIGFRYETSVAPASWLIRACQCTFCRAHDALSTSDPAGSITFIVADPACLQRYQFGLRTADFLLCRQCGVYIGAVIAIGDSKFGIINTHALHAQPDGIADVAAIDYDREDVDGRVSRRQDRWTPASIEQPKNH